MGYIYKITNNINGHIYIGKTERTIEERWNEHLKNAAIHTNRYLYDAMNCYGYDNFSIEEIENCNNDLLNEKEKYWIKKLNALIPNGYNMTLGGNGGNTWEHNSNKIETSKKLSNSIRDGWAKRQGYKSAIEKRELLGVSDFQSNSFDKDKLLKMINEGKRLEEISNYFGLSIGNIIKKCRQLFNKTISELRNDDFLKSGFNNVYTGGNYKVVDKEYLLFLIESNYTNDYICKKLNISEHTLLSKCVEFFGLSIKELKGDTYKKHRASTKKQLSEFRKGKTYEELYGEEEARRQKEMRKEKFIKENNPNYKKIDKEILLNLIKDNTTTDNIINLLNISKPTLYHKCNEFFGKSLKELRKEYAI